MKPTSWKRKSQKKGGFNANAQPLFFTKSVSKTNKTQRRNTPRKKKNKTRNTRTK